MWSIQSQGEQSQLVRVQQLFPDKGLPAGELAEKGLGYGFGVGGGRATRRRREAAIPSWPQAQGD
jgi:hypothetical protein